MIKSIKTERPILFSAQMVKAILEGRKTQTRRVVKSKLIIEQAEFECGNRPHVTLSEPCLQHLANRNCPSGQVGDYLWVRESFMDLSGTGVEHRDSEGKLQKYAYAAECPPGSYSDDVRKEYGLKWKPSIHMPRSASRILLEITNIRVERLDAISRKDATKEGLHQLPATGRYVVNKGDQYFGGASSNPCDVFRWLWESINGADSWVSNPWVWVIEFKVIEGVKS